MNKSIVKRIMKIEWKNSPGKITVVHMWTPDGKDSPIEEEQIHIKASNRGELYSKMPTKSFTLK